MGGENKDLGGRRLKKTERRNACKGRTKGCLMQRKKNYRGKELSNKKLE